MAPRKPPTVRYICLAALFVITCAYQLRATYFGFPTFFGHDAAQMPFIPTYDGGSFATAHFVTGVGGAIGIREGDLVTSVNGRRLSGLAVFGEVIAAAKPGDAMTVTFGSPGQTADRQGTVTLSKQYVGNSPNTPLLGKLIIVVLKLILPIFCILLGFWVAAVRPRDVSAWLLIPVLFGLCTVYGVGIETLGPGIRDIAQAFRASVNNFWPLAMLLFGFYFPENFDYQPPQWLRVPIRVIVVATAIKLVLDVVLEVGQLESFEAIRVLYAVVARFEIVLFFVGVLAASGFFMFMQLKSHAATSPDVKRRFNLIYIGATVGLTPLLILVVFQLVKKRGLEEMFPEWIVLAAYLTLMIFPVTLAYVIVVQRAMDLRMVVRQGLQYALARRGTFVLQVALNGIIILVAGLELQKQHNRLEIVIIVCLGFAAIFWLRSLSERLRASIDKRFFRDAYNADQILSGLSDEVRTIVETRPLLERVTQRIAESLHVPRVAVFTNDQGWFKPAYALGYPSVPEAYFAASGAAMRRISQEREPVRVYLDDDQSWVNAADVSDDERHNLAAIGSQLLLPLTVKEKLLGVISLGEKKSEAPYSGSDLRLLKSVATQTGLALANAQLTSAIAEEVGRREKMSREIEIAREVQERLFPQRLQPISGIEYFGGCRTALGVGGDYYDFLALPDGKLGIALGDISGKGIPAALMMASLQASLRAEASRSAGDIAGLIARVNQALFDASSEDRYATFFYGQYDPANGELVYVNAGHCAPMLFRGADGFRTVDRLNTGGPVIGLIPDCIFEQGMVNMSGGDELVIFTDGVSEAMNRDLEEWGEQRLADTVRNSSTRTAPEVIGQIMAGADAFAAGAPQHDDMTLVVIRARPR
jgi:sigma-B regulation protein RsbU (phosphoserine phosphatase)